MIQVITRLYPSYQKKLIRKFYKFNVKVTSFNYNSSTAGLTVTEISGTPINIEEVQNLNQIKYLNKIYLIIYGINT